MWKKILTGSIFLIPFFLYFTHSATSEIETVKPTESDNIVKIGHVKIDKNLFGSPGNLNEKINTCAQCHGKKGAGDADFGPDAAFGTPALRGLDYEYLEHQLKDYKIKKRNHPEMSIVASILRDDDIESLAEYYANLKVPAPVFPKTSAKFTMVQLQRGQSLANKGRPDDTGIACSNCHQPQGIGLGAAFPRLAGQNAIYIKNQLHAWREGKRKDEDDRAMQEIAQLLTEQEIEDVAAYFEVLVTH